MKHKLCECGCGGEITPKRSHKYTPARFLPGHNSRTDRRPRHIYHPKPEEIPAGLCECGCGNRTEIARETTRKRRWFRGYPLPFLPSHSIRRLREDSPVWKGGRSTDGHGYIKVLVPDHPAADKDGYVREHRHVWEQANGRYLQPGEVVHHINGIKNDNRIENLVRLTRAEHQREHSVAENRMQFVKTDRSTLGKRGAEARWGKK